MLLHKRPPRTTDHHVGFNGRAAALISSAVGSMWTFWGSCVFFAVWMAGLGLSVAGDAYPYNLMLLAVGGIAQWLCMIAILNQGNIQSKASDAQTLHLHELVVQNTKLTEEIHKATVK